MLLTTSLVALPSVGPKLKKTLAKIGLATVGDLLWYFPFRYEDFRRLARVDELRVGDQVTVQVQIELIANKKSLRTRRTFTECLARDASGVIRVMWFNQPFITQQLYPGDTIFLSGKVTRDHLGNILVSPSYERVRSDGQSFSRLIPLYPLTAGLTQKAVRTLVRHILPLTQTLKDWLPDQYKQRLELATLGEALHDMHAPENPESAERAVHRLKFDELFFIQLHAERTRRLRLTTTAPLIPFQETVIKNFVAHLPFTLTAGQRRSAWEIIQDLNKDTPMNRLLSGDVGSGKTVVAAIASLNAARANWQTALMVPTEILATQHFESLCKLLGSENVRIGLYTRTQHYMYLPDEKKSVVCSKKKFLETIEAGLLDVIIGTQALLSENVTFPRLGFVIVDEQHRFGVAQRQAIKAKGATAHFLSMTATPIPRSLALMLYGDLDVSLVRELPPGRKPISTRLVEPHERKTAYDAIRQQVREGRQVFVICPLIEAEALPATPETSRSKDVSAPDLVIPGSPKTPSLSNEMPTSQSSSLFQPKMFNADEKKSVMSEYRRLSEELFPDLKVGFVHGKLKTTEKDETMKKFAAREYDILVATSVVEVGVNIPNATVMMIEGAERFGLAQLHQFRGRVGRSDYQSYCFLFTQTQSVSSKERLHFFASCHDGFRLAEKDLEIRGPGEVYGTEQSGLQELRLAKLTDTPLIAQARDLAHEIAPRLAEFPNIIERAASWAAAAHFE